jgi:hypothetical protein
MCRVVQSLNLSFLRAQTLDRNWIIRPVYNLWSGERARRGPSNSGQLEEALFTVNGAISRSTETGAEFDLPELHQGKILAARTDHPAATAFLRESIAKAQTQHALSLEL